MEWLVGLTVKLRLSQVRRYIRCDVMREADIKAALYLPSDGSRFVNGHALVVDGGITGGATGDRQVQVWVPWMQAVGADPSMVQS